MLTVVLNLIRIRVSIENLITSTLTQLSKKLLTQESKDQIAIF